MACDYPAVARHETKAGVVGAQVRFEFQQVTWTYSSSNIRTRITGSLDCYLLDGWGAMPLEAITEIVQPDLVIQDEICSCVY
jgi:hypothetical protein